MKLAFFGSRTLDDNRAKAIIYESILTLKATEIITAGEPAGICRLAQQVSRELAIPLKLYWLNFKYLRGAFDHRSREIIEYSDHIVIIHDGVSKGTANELELVVKKKREHTYEVLEPEAKSKETTAESEIEWKLLDIG